MRQNTSCFGRKYENVKEQNIMERERILSILKGEQPDRLPWCADLAYWIHYLEEDNIYPEKYKNTKADNGVQQLHRDLDCGFYLQGYEPFSFENPNLKIETEQNGSEQIRKLVTPSGTLTQISEYSKATYSAGIKKHFVEDADDLKIYCDMMEDMQFSPNYDLAEARKETIGDNGVVLCYTPKSPLMRLIALDSGVENFTYMMLDEEETVKDCLLRIEKKFDEACEIVLNSPAECIMIPENITSECVKPYYELMEGYHKKWTKRIRDNGKYSFVHLDGTVRGLVGELSKRSGFDVIEAITPMPVGDVEIDEVRSLVDPDTIIWGGIPGGFFREDSLSDEEFDAHVRHVIDVMTKEPKYVLGVADQVVPGSSARRIKRVRELVNEYGTY